MPRRANLILLMLLALVLGYGRFVVPSLLATPDGEATLAELEDEALQASQREPEVQLMEWIREQDEWWLRREKARLSHRAMAMELIAVSKKPVECRIVMALGTMIKVQGHVTASSPEGDLVMLDVGKDAGAIEGHSLEVHRTGPVPFAVGKLTIEKVWPERAVARAVTPCPPIRRGDEVRGQIIHFDSTK